LHMKKGTGECLLNRDWKRKEEKINCRQSRKEGWGEFFGASRGSGKDEGSWGTKREGLVEKVYSDSYRTKRPRKVS